MNARVLLLLLLLSPLVARPATYYVSATGNDSNSGTSQAQAWRTIARAQQVTQSMQPGDRILFERGGTYSGTLHLNSNGTAANPLVFGAYGSGPLPVISGGVPVTGWTRHQGNVWRAPFSGTPKYLMVGDSPMTLARHPNTGWLRNAQGSNTTINAGSALNQPNGHWTGATAVVRTTNWSYDNVPVSGFNNGTLTLGTPLGINLGNADWGFFLCNKLSALDMAGEWYHDAGTGQVYLWAPGNADPNSLQVLASIHDHGMAPGWQRQHILVQDLAFQGQTAAGISTDVAHYVTVTGCAFRNLYKAISSSGSNNRYVNNTIQRTFATAINIYGEPNTVVEGNTLTDIAIDPGMGEPGWGYMGIVISGTGTVVRGNRLTNIGYIGIATTDNGLVERNVVRYATSILNDGAAITFDRCDGVVVRDNIVLDMVCDLASVATSHVAYHKIGFGIYFGNTSIRNTLVERNTVARCDGAGIHVDHTKLSAGNRIKDNVLFDNAVQLNLSDYSNTSGPGAAPPYYVPSYNTEYSGNVMYSVRPEQLTMHHLTCYSPLPVSFGTFTNNRYFSPYEELSILVRNLSSSTQERFTLEQWQASRNTDAGSTRSPLRSPAYHVDQVLSPNLIPNGDFGQNVSGWEGWPTETAITRDQTFLDNGALKLDFLNNNTYDIHFLHPSAMPAMQSGQWYRLRVSLQSTVTGILQFDAKGQSQLTGPYAMYTKYLPFSDERRDLSIFFQSDRSEPVRGQFVNHWTERTYWLDNISLERVAVRPVDPLQDHLLFVNDQSATQVFSLPPGCWKDVFGNTPTGSITVAPFSSRILYRYSSECGSTPVQDVGARVLLNGPLNLVTGLMRTDLRDLGLLPQAEPYTAMSVEVENSGAVIAPSLMQATGTQAIVDWVVLELRNANHTVAARRAALVRANGDVVATDGSARVAFNATVEGRHLVVRHRNHLPAMAAVPLSAPGQVVDFTSSGTTLYGQNALRVNGSLRSLWPGDVNMDGAIRYTGMWNDRDEVLVAIGSTVPSNTVQGYLREDVNMDGLVKYVGTGNDRDPILTAIGGSVPTTVRIGQVP